VRIFIRLLVCALSFALTVFASSPETSRLSGTVTDTEGGVISGAYVLVHWDHCGSEVGLTSNVGIKSDLRLQTDRNGAYSVNLPPGFYDVFVFATSFTPTCSKVRIRAEQGAVLSPKLNADPVVGRELGEELGESVHR
jgi:hypothetical protein